MFKALHTIITPVVWYNFKTAFTVHNFHSQGSIPCRPAYRGAQANTYTTYPSHPTGYPFIHLGGEQPGGWALTSKMDRGCRWGGGGVKTWPCLKPLGAQKYTLSQYTLLKTFICIPCTGTDRSSYIHKNLLRPARTVAGAKIAGLS